jgi:hypothetical protein
VRTESQILDQQFQLVDPLSEPVGEARAISPDHDLGVRGSREVELLACRLIHDRHGASVMAVIPVEITDEDTSIQHDHRHSSRNLLR